MPRRLIERSPVWDVRRHFVEDADRTAVRDPRDASEISYGDLDARSRALADHLYEAGIRRRDVVLACLPNELRYPEIVWAAQRSGLHYVTASPRSTVGELRHLLTDSGARAVIAGSEQLEAMDAAVAGLDGVAVRLALDASDAPFRDYEQTLAEVPPQPDRPEIEGRHMAYTSGTTGRPKGVKQPIGGRPLGSEEPYLAEEFESWGYGAGSVFACPAPFYHSACVWLNAITHRFGGTVLVVERFEAETFLRLIEAERVTHAYLVPTMFKRLLDLPDEIRLAADVSSLRHVMHMAAPCPVAVKERMIEWLGPVLVEVYGGSEENGATVITSEEWLSHPGSVGRARYGRLHIIGPEGEELPPGEVGDVYFSGGGEFSYHNDPEKTAAAHDTEGRSTIGDLGYLDAEGYLYLTGRRHFTIISGGNNVYPAEVEDALASHPAVAGAAVFGLPDRDLGERVHAVVELEPGVPPREDLPRELLEHCRSELSGYKCPKAVEIVAELPRDDSGKLRRAQLREERSGA